MAVVSFEIHKKLSESMKYITEDRSPDDVLSASNCEVEGAVEQFQNTKRLHDKMDGNQAFVLIQSFPPKERNLKTPEEFHELGKKLAEGLFPGFEAVVRTHTDKGHIHNHIVINTIHPETGVRIGNERRWGRIFGPPSNKAAMDLPEVAAFAAVYRDSKSDGKKHLKMLNVIRMENDKIAREAGLSVLESRNIDHDVIVPKNVMRMEQNKKDSWVLDLIQKATYVRGHTTSYDEYRNSLKEHFNIDVRVENKNIIYTYPGGQRRTIRGKRIGKNFDKEGLERNFENNDRMFAARPELRAERLADVVTLKNHGGSLLRDSSGVLLEPGGARTIFTKDYGAYTPTARRGRAPIHASDADPSCGLVPLAEIRKAKGSIFDYCKKNKIALTEDKQGRTVLKGREHVVVSEFEVLNTRSNTGGSLIDFVAIHKSMTYLQAIAHINDNPRLLLLEQYWGERKRSFNAFYIPKQDHMDRSGGQSLLTKFFKTFGASEKTARGLLDKGQAQVSKTGAIRLFGDGDGSGGLEFVSSGSDPWTSRPNGKMRRPFYASKPRAGTVHVFLDPKEFLAKHGEDVFGRHREMRGVLALLAPEPQAVDHYLSEHRETSRIAIVHPKRPLTPHELDFFGVLKKRFQPFGIEVEHDVKGPERSRGPELSL